MASQQHDGLHTASHRGSSSGTMDRWASLVRPFPPRNPCDQPGRKRHDKSLGRKPGMKTSCDRSETVAQEGHGKDDEPRTPSQAQCLEEVIDRGRIDNAGAHGGTDEEQDISDGPSHSSVRSVREDSSAHSYVAPPDAHEEMVGLGSNNVTKRYLGERERLRKPRSFTGCLRSPSIDWASKPGLKQEVIRLSSLPSLPLSGYERAPASTKRDKEPIDNSEGSVVGTIDGLAFPAPLTYPQTRLPASDLVTWNGRNDPEHPFNWTTRKRVLSTTLLLSLVFCTTLASSVLPTAGSSGPEMLHTLGEVTVLVSVLTVLGIAVGAPIWGSISNIHGRKGPLFCAFGIFVIFNVPVGLAQDLQTILAFRFFLGFFGAGSLTIVPLCITDVWQPPARDIALSFFNATCIVGSIVGNLTGGYLGQEPTLGWRWTAVVIVGLSIICGLPAAFLNTESSARILLHRKARGLRFLTNDWALHARTEESDVDIQYYMGTTVSIFMKPAFVLPTLHMAFAHGILYLLYVPYFRSFHLTRGWSLDTNLLTLLPVALGAIIGIFINFIVIRKKETKTDGHTKANTTEARLLPMMIGSALLPAGLLVFAWTSDPEVFFAPEIMAGVPIGIGISLITIGGFNYIVDGYVGPPSSAVGANIFVRSVFACGFPLAGLPVYAKLGVQWATSTLAFIAIVLASIPLILLRGGQRWK